MCVDYGKHVLNMSWHLHGYYSNGSIPAICVAQLWVPSQVCGISSGDPHAWTVLGQDLDKDASFVHLLSTHQTYDTQVTCGGCSGVWGHDQKNDQWGLVVAIRDQCKFVLTFTYHKLPLQEYVIEIKGGYIIGYSVVLLLMLSLNCYCKLWTCPLMNMVIRAAKFTSGCNEL